MKTESLINGLFDISNNTIPADCIIDMVPEIIEKLQLLMVEQITFPQHIGIGKVFISGRISSIKRIVALNHFTHAERHLKACGYNVINPLKLIKPTTSRETAMKIYISSLVNNCDKICLLNDWRLSMGSRLLYSIATSLNFEIVDLAKAQKIAV